MAQNPKTPKTPKPQRFEILILNNIIIKIQKWIMHNRPMLMKFTRTKRKMTKIKAFLSREW